MIEILRKYCVYLDPYLTTYLCEFEYPHKECCEINCPIIKELREKIK